MNQIKEDVWARWQRFAERNNLLFATWCDLDFKAKVVAEYKGACPCKPEERPWCPCPEAIKECQEKGACFCRVFISLDYDKLG